MQTISLIDKASLGKMGVVYVTYVMVTCFNTSMVLKGSKLITIVKCAKL